MNVSLIQRPIKPKRPSKNDSPPLDKITVTKILVFNENTKKYEAIDYKNCPDAFNGDLDSFNCNELEAYYVWDIDRITYQQMMNVYRDCNFPADDFIITPQYNRDGYYEYTTIEYQIPDPDYNKKLEVFHDRFTDYERQLRQYYEDLAAYEGIKKEKRREKLEQELKSLKET